jgi:hypothetical protein
LAKDNFNYKNQTKTNNNSFRAISSEPIKYSDPIKTINVEEKRNYELKTFKLLNYSNKETDQNKKFKTMEEPTKKISITSNNTIVSDNLNDEFKLFNSSIQYELT